MTDNRIRSVIAANFEDGVDVVGYTPIYIAYP